MMKNQFIFEARDDYLLLRITGTYDFKEFLALPDLIKARCEEEKVFKVLMNASNVKAGNLSTADRYFLGEKLALELRSRYAVAVVWPPEYIDKFAETGLTPEPAIHVKPPLIKECPVNLECKVIGVISLGSHDLFVGDALAMHAEEEILLNSPIASKMVRTRVMDVRVGFSLLQLVFSIR